MSRFLMLLAIACGGAGCAGMAHRGLGMAEIRSLATAEIRQCCGGSTSWADLSIETTPTGWRVGAPSTCAGVAGASTVAGRDRSIDEVEKTTILCVGGGASLFYDKEGTLLELIKWQ